MLDSEGCLRQIMAIRGALGAALVDYGAGLAVWSAGQVPGERHDVAAEGVAGLVTSVLASPTLAPVGHPGRLDGIVVTAGNGYHLLHFVSTRPGTQLVLYVWLDRVLGNLAMAQHRLNATAAELMALRAPLLALPAATAS